MALSQSVKDALADAETLRRVAREEHGRGFNRTNLGQAARHGEYVERVRPWLHDSAPASVAAAATHAARAAFRAVPGLRGE